MDYRNILFISDFLELVRLASPLPRKLPPVYRCYHAVKVRSIFTSKTAFNSIHKDLLTILKQSLLIYKFNCRCYSVYKGRTCRCLEVRIRQHVPRDIQNKGRLTSGLSQAMGSAIGEHLLAINTCRTNYQDNCFFCSGYS